MRENKKLVVDIGKIMIKQKITKEKILMFYWTKTGGEKNSWTETGYLKEMVI